MIYIHFNFSITYLDAGMEPIRSKGWGVDCFFINSIMFFAQSFPWIIRVTNVLNSMYPPHGVG